MIKRKQKIKRILREAERRFDFISSKYGFWKPMFISMYFSIIITLALSAFYIRFINLNPGIIFQVIFCFLVHVIIFYKHIYSFARRKK